MGGISVIIMAIVFLPVALLAWLIQYFGPGIGVVAIILALLCAAVAVLAVRLFASAKRALRVLGGVLFGFGASLALLFVIAAVLTLAAHSWIQSLVV